MTDKAHSLMSESWNMLLTYVTALVLVFALTFHLLLQSPLTGVPLDSTLTFGYATDNLTYYKVVFGLLLFAGIIHGLNGIRVIALEWFPPQEERMGREPPRCGAHGLSAGPRILHPSFRLLTDPIFLSGLGLLASSKKAVLPYSVVYWFRRARDPRRLVRTDNMNVSPVGFRTG